MQILKSKDMTIQKKYRALSLLLIWIFLICMLEFSVLVPVHRLYLDGASTYLSLGCFIVLFTGSAFTAYRMDMPLKCYGFIKPTARSIYESITISLLFCVVVFAIKAWLITHVSTFYQYPLFEIFSAKAKTSTLILCILAYWLACPFQALIFHGFTEGPLIDLLDTRMRALTCIGLTVFFFTIAHLFISISLTILVILPILLWCILYYRHRCVWTIMISHILIGSILMQIIGLDPFTKIINTFIQ